MDDHAVPRYVGFQLLGDCTLVKGIDTRAHCLDQEASGEFITKMNALIMRTDYSAVLHHDGVSKALYIIERQGPSEAPSTPTLLRRRQDLA